MKLSKRIQEVSPSPTLAITQKAAELKKNGVDIVSFGAGEPDFNTPAPIINSAKEALDEGFTRYAPVPGIPELKTAICNHIKDRRGVEYSPDQIISTCGAKAAIFIAMQAILDEGDEVIIPSPYWVSYPEQVKLAGGKPVVIDTKEENNFLLTPSELETKLTSNTKMIIINSPSNPVGTVYSKDALNAIIDICVKNKIIIIADEIYDKLVYSGEYASVLTSHPEAKENTIYINGVSKSFAMTGWRMGFAAGPVDVIKAMSKYQGQLYTSIPTFVQKACTQAFNAPNSMIADMLVEFKKRCELVFNLLSDIPGIKCLKPEGAFYAFPNISNYIGKSYNGKTISNSQDLATYLLEEAHTAVVPGSAFGAEGYIRLSFATSEELIKKGVLRIKDALNKLS